MLSRHGRIFDSLSPRIDNYVQRRGAPTQGAIEKAGVWRVHTSTHLRDQKWKGNALSVLTRTPAPAGTRTALLPRSPRHDFQPFQPPRFQNLYLYLDTSLLILSITSCVSHRPHEERGEVVVRKHNLSIGGSQGSPLSTGRGRTVSWGSGRGPWRQEGSASRPRP